MVRYSFVALAFAFGLAYAASYDDYFRGVEAMRASNIDVAISAFTSALNAGDLAPSYVPNAYFGRAQAYMRKLQCASAMADLDAALKMRPKYLEAYILRANANRCLNKPDAVLADLTAAIAISPTAPFYRLRGEFHWYHGEFALAADDYLQASKLAPKNGNYLLWFAISSGRVGSFDAAGFAQKVSDLDLDDWPAPLLDYIRGKKTADDVYRKAARGDGDVPTNQKCEADFYIAEWRLAGKDPSAKALLQQAENECPHNFVEYAAAREDLKRVP
ncbi:MAG: hypothetical protein WCA81_07125 [Rhizomicrobium sp.]